MKIKKIVWEYRLSYLSLLLLSITAFITMGIGVIVVLFIILYIAKLNIDALIKDNFFTGFFVTVLASILAFATFKFQERKSKKESITIEYYKNIIVPLYESLINQKEEVVISRFARHIDSLEKSISQIDYKFYIPVYLKESIDTYNQIMLECHKMKKRLNEVFYANAFLPKCSSDFGINGQTSMDYIQTYLSGNPIIFIYSIQAVTYEEEKQIEFNKLVLNTVSATKEFKDFIAKYDILIKIMNELDKYLVYFIRKSKARVI
jgi:hypothetical protein